MKLLSHQEINQTFGGASLAKNEWATVCALGGNALLSNIVAFWRYEPTDIIISAGVRALAVSVGTWAGFQMFHTFVEN